MKAKYDAPMLPRKRSRKSSREWSRKCTRECPQRLAFSVLSRRTQAGCGGLGGENPAAFPKAQPFSLPGSAQTLAGIAFRAAGKSVRNFPPASKFARKLFQGRKKSTKINFLGPETARWGGGLPLEGVVVENFVPALETSSSLGFEERNLGCPGNFAGMSRTPGGVQKVCAKKVRAHFSFPKLFQQRVSDSHSLLESSEL